MADPTSLDKTPTQNQSLNKPEGGTYGEKAEVDRLKKELPSGQGPGGPQQVPRVAGATEPLKATTHGQFDEVRLALPVAPHEEGRAG